MESEYHVKKFYTGSRIIENVCVNTIDNKIDDWNKESFDTHKSFEYMIPSFIDLQIYGAKNSLLMVEPKEETIKKIKQPIRQIFLINYLSDYLSFQDKTFATILICC